MDDAKEISLVKAYAAYPRTLEEVVTSVRELLAGYDIEEIILRPGEPIVYVYREEDSSVESVDVTPYDIVRLSPMEEIDPYPENASAFSLVEVLLHNLTMRGVWPVCLVVQDSDKFLKSLGFGDGYLRSVYPPAFLGYPIVQDSRVSEGVVIAAATPGQRDGYGRIHFSMFAHLD